MIAYLSSETQSLPDDPLARALQRWPDRPAMALLRALEARHYQLDGDVSYLDLGCGNGKFAELIGLAGAVGVDLDIPDLARARRSSAYREVLVADMRSLPFGDGECDGAICNSTLEHIPDDGAVLREVARVLRPGGELLFTVPGPAKESMLYFGRAEVVGDGRARAYREWFTSNWEHQRYRSTLEWQSMLETVGFRTVRTALYEGSEAASIGDVLGYVNTEFREPPVVGAHPAPRELFVRMMYEVLIRVWRADTNLPLAGGLFLQAVRR